VLVLLADRGNEGQLLGGVLLGLEQADEAVLVVLVESVDQRLLVSFDLPQSLSLGPANALFPALDLA
jgi:hypothetical protein